MDFCHRILGLIFMAMNRPKRHKILLASLYLIPFLALYVISVAVLSELYLFKWLLDRWYLCIWIFAMILAYKGEYFIANSLTIGSIFRVFVGQFYGDFIRNRNIHSITSSMSQTEQARMYLHPGV